MSGSVFPLKPYAVNYDEHIQMNVLLAWWVFILYSEYKNQSLLSFKNSTHFTMHMVGSVKIQVQSRGDQYMKSSQTYAK